MLERVKPSGKAAQKATKAVKASSFLKKSKRQAEKSSKPLTLNMKATATVKFRLPEAQLRKIHDQMVMARALEERLIKMYKQSEGAFWIGGPGEEAFNTSLGLQVKKGEGINYDYLHLHYRSSAILLGMGANPIDAIRQMKSSALDPYSGGRNFSNHYSIRKWNVVPVSSTIETQYATAIGTGLAQRGDRAKGITIVNGGDAGTAEGEFASCLVWSSRPDFELPILMIVTNNEWGISTPAATQIGDRRICERGTAYGIKNRFINGNDVEEAWFALKEAMDYVRTERKPFLMEAKVARLYGHSSASGANLHKEEIDPIVLFEQKLQRAGVMSPKEIETIRERHYQEILDMYQRVKEEPLPDASTMYDHFFQGSKGKPY